MSAPRPAMPLRFDPENEAILRNFADGLLSEYGRFRSGHSIQLPRDGPYGGHHERALMVGYNPSTGCFRLAVRPDPSGTFKYMDRPASLIEGCNPPNTSLQDIGRDFPAESRAYTAERADRYTRLQQVSETLQAQMQETVAAHLAVFAATRDPAVVRECRAALEELDQLHDDALLRLAAPFGDLQDERDRRAVRDYLERKRGEFARHYEARREELRKRQEDSAREIQVERQRPRAIRPAAEAATEFIRQLEALEAEWRAQGCTPDEIAEKRDRAERIFRDAVAERGDSE